MGHAIWRFIVLVVLSPFAHSSINDKSLSTAGSGGRQLLSGGPCEGLNGYAPVCIAFQLSAFSLERSAEPACTSNSAFAGCDGRYLDHPDNSVCCCCPGGNADPQFIGLDGRKFDFAGKPDTIFNLLSERNHQLNSRFVAGPHLISSTGGKKLGTYMGSIALQAYDTQVEATVDEAGNMTTNIDGAEVEGLEEEDGHKRVIEKPHGVIVTVELYKDHLGHSIGIQTPMFAMTFYPSLRQWDAELNQTTRGYINLAMAVDTTRMHATSMHGIVGQTTPDRAPVVSLLPPELRTQWLGEGSEEDYIVSSLFGTDFKYNRFGEDVSSVDSLDKRHADALKGGRGADAAALPSRRMLNINNAPFSATARVAGIAK